MNAAGRRETRAAGRRWRARPQRLLRGGRPRHEERATTESIWTNLAQVDRKHGLETKESSIRRGLDVRGETRKKTREGRERREKGKGGQGSGRKGKEARAEGTEHLGVIRVTGVRSLVRKSAAARFSHLGEKRPAYFFPSE